MHAPRAPLRARVATDAMPRAIPSLDGIPACKTTVPRGRHAPSNRVLVAHFSQ
jgi:hypothetical protein